MRKPRRFAGAAAVALLVTCGLGCSLLQLAIVNPEEQRRQAEEQTRANEQERKEKEERSAAEEAKREQTILDGLTKLRSEIALGGADKAAKSIEFAKLVVDANGTKASKDGRLDMEKLSLEAATNLERVITTEPSMDLWSAMIDLPETPQVNAAVVRACPRVRPKVSEADVPGFVGACLDSARGDAKQLKWPNVQRDLAAYKKAEEQRLAAEAKAEEQRLAAEAKAKQEEGKVARYAAAAVFASGRCNFSNCLKDGWTTSTPDGDIQVRCDFQDCFKNGWTARFPDGGEARTRCSFQNCMKDGWETTYPDGKVARTRCSFQDCLKDGWETELPSGGTARTRCSFQDCSKDGWQTDLPGGGQVQCRCNFQKCFENGATCG